MTSAKKDKSRPKKEKPTKPDSDSDSDSDSDAKSDVEEVVENPKAREKREKGKRALMGLLRKVTSWIVLALVLSQAPFLSRPRQAGVNRAKVTPLQLALVWLEHAPLSVNDLPKPSCHVACCLQ